MTQEEKQKLMVSLKESHDERAKTILKDVFGIAECPFEPFDRVLVRDNERESWKPYFFFQHIKSNQPFVCIGGTCWKQCISWEGHEHLVGKTNKPE